MKQKNISGLIISAIFTPLIAMAVVHPHTTLTTHEATQHEPVKTTETKSSVKAKEAPSKAAATKLKTTDKPVSTATDKKFVPATRAVIQQNINRIFALKGNPSSLKGMEILKMSGDPAIKGKDAAMLAAMIVNISNKPADQSYTREQLIEMARGTYYMSAKNIDDIKALPANQKLWGPNGLTPHAQIIQGYEGDCFLLSAVHGVLQTTPDGPQLLHDMIKPVKNNPDQFIVTFPGKPPVTVNLTDTEIGMYSHVVNGGKWLAVLSVAESQVLAKSSKNPARVLIANGYAQQTLTLLTGKKYMTRHFYKMTTRQIEKEIKTALKNSSPVAIQTDDHDLTVTAYHENGNNPAVTIKNPWGTTEWYNPVTGKGSYSKNKPQQGSPWYFMKNGVFTVPVSAITNGFNSVVVPAGENKRD